MEILDKRYMLLPDQEVQERPLHYVTPPSRQRTFITLATSLMLSIFLNLYFVTWPYTLRREAFGPDEALSEFAQLPTDQYVAWNHGSIWAQDSEAAIREWEAQSIDNGIVAIPKDLARKHELPLAQSFPWDTTKGLYVLNGFHNLHCLKLIHESLTAFHLGKEQPRPYGHILHCVDALRQDVICNADDTPRYTTVNNDTITGANQLRKCRSWKKLEEFGRKNSACFSYIHETSTTFPNIQRFRFCPKDSPYKDTAERYFLAHSFNEDAVLERDVAANRNIDIVGSMLKREEATATVDTMLRRQDAEPENIAIVGSVLKREEATATVGMMLRR